MRTWYLFTRSEQQLNQDKYNTQKHCFYWQLLVSSLFETFNFFFIRTVLWVDFNSGKVQSVTTGLA